MDECVLRCMLVSAGNTLPDLLKFTLVVAGQVEGWEVVGLEVGYIGTEVSNTAADSCTGYAQAALQLSTYSSAGCVLRALASCCITSQAKIPHPCTGESHLAGGGSGGGLGGGGLGGGLHQHSAVRHCRRWMSVC